MELTLYFLAIFCFILVIVLSFRPVYIYTKLKTRIECLDNHDYVIYGIHFIGVICTLIPWSVTIYRDEKLSFQEDTFISIVFVLVILFIAFVITVFILGFIQALKQRQSIRPLHCSRCKKALKRLNSTNGLLTQQELVAEKIKSITFEAWYCHSCSPVFEQKFTHLRAYVNLSDKFAFCQNCNEVTMTKTSIILSKATTAEEGTRLIVSQCHCCSARKEKLEVIPPIDRCR